MFIVKLQTDIYYDSALSYYATIIRGQSYTAMLSERFIDFCKR